MKTGDIVKNRALMDALREVREKIYLDLSVETREELRKKNYHLSDEEKEVLEYFLEPATKFNFYLKIS